MKYPDIKTYEILYARFLLEDRSKQMMDLVGDLEGKVFMDICCGSGKLTKEAISMNTKKNIMIDAEATMIKDNFWCAKVADIYVEEVQNAFIKLFGNYYDKIDVAVCQQGINYWLDKDKAKRLSLLMKKGGIFVFNTFNQKPSTFPSTREYSLKNIYGKIRHYIEVSWRIEGEHNDVQHVQICEGIEPHFTKFKWMDEEYIRNCLDKFFEIEIITDGKTDIYRCVKK